MNTIASAPFFVKLFLFFQHFAVFYSSFFVHLDPAFYFIGCMLPHRRLGRIPFIILHFHRICSGFLSFLLFFLLFHPETASFPPASFAAGITKTAPASFHAGTVCSFRY